MHITYDTLVYGSTHTGVNIYIYIRIYVCHVLYKIYSICNDVIYKLLQAYDSCNETV